MQIVSPSQAYYPLPLLCNIPTAFPADVNEPFPLLSNLPTVDHSPVSGPSSTPGASPPQAETESVDAAPDDSRQGGEGGGEEDTCMVCWAKSTDTEAGDGNPMYKCTSCDIIVHSLCYGAEGSRKGWTCKACKEGVVGAKCRLCPNKGGVVKRAKDGSWVHLECALWIPEVRRRSQPLNP
jgi:hypothetical protein